MNLEDNTSENPNDVLPPGAKMPAALALAQETFQEEVAVLVKAARAKGLHTVACSVALYDDNNKACVGIACEAASGALIAAIRHVLDAVPEIAQEVALLAAEIMFTRGGERDPRLN